MSADRYLHFLSFRASLALLVWGNPRNAPSSTSDTMNILIIDDDPAVHDLLPSLPELKSHTFSSAFTGQEGLAKAKKLRPDLILLDQFLPDMSGTIILSNVKHDPVTAHIPVAMLSNYANPRLLKAVMAEGAIAAKECFNLCLYQNDHRIEMADDRLCDLPGLFTSAIDYSKPNRARPRHTAINSAPLSVTR
jgi:CheY-like chemotaxis protein